MHRSTVSRRSLLRRGAVVAGAAAMAPLVSSRIAGSTRRAEPVTIEYWHINTESFGGPAVQELVQRFQAANPDIAVREQFQPRVYTGLLENLQAALAAGAPPDLAQIGYLYLDYVTDNFPFVPIDDLAAGGTPDFLTGFPANILALGQRDGRQVGMPYAISNPLVYYNADLFRQAGLDPDAPPTTWDAWREAAGPIKERTGRPALYVRTIDDNWTTQALIESNGGEVLACRDGRAVAAFGEPPAVAAVQMWADLIGDGLALNALEDAGNPAFLGQSVAAILTTIANRDSFERQAGFELRAAPFPSFGEQPPRLPAGGNNLFVFSNDEAKRRATWRFVEYLQSPEGLTIWTKGTGYLPPRAGVAEDPRYLGGFLRDNPIQAVAVAQTPLVVPWTSFPGPNGLQASQALFNATQRALGDRAVVGQALGEAAAEVDALIEGESC